MKPESVVYAGTAIHVGRCIALSAVMTCMSFGIFGLTTRSMRIAVLVPDDNAIGRLGSYARKAFASVGHEVVLLAHPAETLSSTFRFRRRRVGLITALNEAAYCLYEGRYMPWQDALVALGLEARPNFDGWVEDTLTEELGYQLQALSVDLLVAIGCSPINVHALPADMLGLNIHPGVLPRYRGVGNPEAIVRGVPSHVGYTVHHLTERLDGGEVFLRKRCLSAPAFNAPLVYLTSYRSALDALAGRIENAFCGSWPMEDDFSGIPLPDGDPLWRMTLTRVCSWKIKALVGVF